MAAAWLALMILPSQLCLVAVTAAFLDSSPVSVHHAVNLSDDPSDRISLVSWNVLTSDPVNGADLARYRAADWERAFGTGNGGPTKRVVREAVAQLNQRAAEAASSSISSSSGNRKGEIDFIDRDELVSSGKWQFPSEEDSAGNILSSAEVVRQAGTLARLIEMFDEQRRYRRIEARLAREIEVSKTAGRSLPIFFLSEVSVKWHARLAKFFLEKNFRSYFAPACARFGLMFAYPVADFEEAAFPAYEDAPQYEYTSAINPKYGNTQYGVQVGPPPRKEAKNMRIPNKLRAIEEAEPCPGYGAPGDCYGAPGAQSEPWVPTPGLEVNLSVNSLDTPGVSAKTLWPVSLPPTAPVAEAGPGSPEALDGLREDLRDTASELVQYGNGLGVVMGEPTAGLEVPADQALEEIVAKHATGLEEGAAPKAFGFTAADLREVYVEALFKNAALDVRGVQEMTQDVHLPRDGPEYSHSIRYKLRPGRGFPFIMARLRLRDSHSRPFYLVHHHFPMKVFWKTPTNKIQAGHEVMALHLFNMLWRVRGILAFGPTRFNHELFRKPSVVELAQAEAVAYAENTVPALVFSGDCNTKPNEARFRYLHPKFSGETIPPFAEDASGMLIRVLHAANSVTRGYAGFPSCMDGFGCFKRDRSAVSNAPGGAMLPPDLWPLGPLLTASWGHVYTAMHGGFKQHGSSSRMGPESSDDINTGDECVTTRTQQFAGFLDHTLATLASVELVAVEPMPTLGELARRDEFHPNLDREPSDHLLQRVEFRVK